MIPLKYAFGVSLSKFLGFIVQEKKLTLFQLRVEPFKYGPIKDL